MKPAGSMKPRFMKRSWTLALSLGAAGLLAACSSVQSLSYSMPPPTTATTAPSLTPFTLPDLVGAQRAACRRDPDDDRGRRRSAARRTINGTVLGPGGAVAGATVQADRLVGDQVASTQATTAADGSFTISSVLGGRYRSGPGWSPRCR